MFMCVYSVFVLSCLQVAALRRPDRPSKEAYRLCKKIKKLKSGQAPRKRYRAIGRQTDETIIRNGSCTEYSRLPLACTESYCISRKTTERSNVKTT
jgi:hypothetical protein